MRTSSFLRCLTGPIFVDFSGAKRGANRGRYQAASCDVQPD
jgi:hypothetical protein